MTISPNEDPLELGGPGLVSPGCEERRLWNGLVEGGSDAGA
jgi:hypothetical protein